MPQSPLLHTAHYFFAQLMPKTVKVTSHCRPLRTILTSQGPARSCPAPETSFLKLTTKRSCAIARKRDAHPDLISSPTVQLETGRTNEFTADLRCHSVRRFAQISGHLRTDGS